MLQLFRAISAVLVLIVIALVSALITMRLAIHGAEVKVPKVSGMPISQAVTVLHRNQLRAGIDGHFYSTFQPAGVVLTQSPAPGTRVRKSWRVRMTESLGPQKVAIPRLDGMDAALATITVRRSALQVGNVVALPYPYAPENTVIAQTPLALSTGVADPKISILTAQPVQPAQDTWVMPDLTGESFTAAALAIMHAGFKLAPLQNAAQSGTEKGPNISASGVSGSPLATNSSGAAGSRAPSGTVIAQVPAAGDRIPAGASIQLTVQP